jgi:hypothetical protein
LASLLLSASKHPFDAFIWRWGHLVTVVAIVNGNECAGARKSSYCTCMGEGKDVVDFAR